MKKQCEYCGQEFEGRARKKFCSQACSNRARGTKSVCAYEKCGKKFKPTNKGQEFCSHLCKARATRPYRSDYVECPVCRKWHSLRQRWYICCSMKCYNEWQMYKNGVLRQDCDYYLRKEDAEKLATPGTMAVDR